MSSVTTIDIGPHLFCLSVAWTLYVFAAFAHRHLRSRSHKRVTDSQPDPAPAPEKPLSARASAATAQPPAPAVARKSDPVGEVCRIVAGRYGVSVEQLLSPSRAQPAATARQVAMRLTRETLRLSYAQIGARFHRDHSTVLHAIRQTDGLALEDLREEIFAAVS